MVAIIDKGKTVETVSGVEAYMINHRTGMVDLYTSPEQKTTVNNTAHKITLQRNGIAWAVIKDGRFVG